jgi:AraC-like DNA-binding protein
MPAWKRTTVRPGHCFPRHAHGDWSVAVVRAGAGFVQTSGTWHVARPGTITVLHPGESHRSRTHPEAGLDYLVVTVTGAMGSELYGRRAMPRFPRPVLDDPGCAAALLAACDAAAGSGPAPLVAALGRLFRSHARDEHGPRRHSAAIRRLLDHLDDHYAARMTLRDMASVAHVSAATLVRRFHSETGMTPHEYLVSRRIDAARALIGRSDQPLPEIARLTGFADQSHLHRHFTRIVGVTPGGFRRS